MDPPLVPPGLVCIDTPHILLVNILCVCSIFSSHELIYLKIIILLNFMKYFHWDNDVSHFSLLFNVLTSSFVLLVFFWGNCHTFFGKRRKMMNKWMNE